MAQAEGINRPTDNTHLKYKILREVLDLAPLGEDAPVSDRIAVARIDVAAHLEYARREFVNASKALPEGASNPFARDDKVLGKYRATWGQYQEAMQFVDSFEKQYGSQMEPGDHEYIATLRKRAAIDGTAAPWSYVR
jgi:hypothetical protein